MKQIFFLIAAAVLASACAPKKTETTEVTDSLKMDSVIQADTPAPASLAFSLMPGYSAKNTVALADTVNFILLLNQQDIDKNFVLDKAAANAIANPDFIINYNIGVVCLPSQLATTISLDKVEVVESNVNMYVNIKRGEKLSLASKPAQIFAVERRDGVGTIQFYVNGKIDKSFFLTGM